MTLQVSGADVMAAVEVAAWVGSIVVMLAIGLLVYLMVRPPRRAEAARAEPDAIAVEEMLALMERMERRLETLERAVAREAADEERILEAGADRPQARRSK